MRIMEKEFEILAIDADFSLVHNVAKSFDKQLYVPKVVQFADGEYNVSCPDLPIRGKDFVVIHSTSEPVNANLIKLLFLIGQLKECAAHRVHVIIPYFGYSRQTEGDNGQEHGNAKIVAKMIEAAGADSVASVEIHEAMLGSFFSVPFCDIDVESVIADHVKKTFSDLESVCLVAPDGGAKDRVKAVVDILQVPYVCFHKKRCGADKVEIVGMTGECSQKIAIIIDDIIGTAGTAIKVSDVLLANGALQVFGYFIHPVLAGHSAQLVQKSKFEKIYVSNSIDLAQDERVPTIEVFDISSAISSYIHSLMRV